MFQPRSIAIIGASKKPGKIGHDILKNLIDYGYSGRIYPVNPNIDEIYGLKSYPSILSIPDEVDVAIIAIPAEKVLSVAEECGIKGVKILVVITSGFSEVGNVDAEANLVKIAKKYGMRILGPNIFGYVYTPSKLNATFGPREVLGGNIAFITQSGALGIALMGWTIMEEIGLSSIVSLGNMSDIDMIELSEYFAEDPNTKVIAMYLEGLKPGSGKDFVERMRRVVLKKTVIVIKAGRSERGALAVASHTGSLAGSDMLYDAAFKQAGVIRAYGIEELFDYSRAFATQPLPQGEETIIITNGGGAGVMATDAAEENGIKLLNPSDSLREAFRKTMPWFGSSKNPIDLTGQAVVENYVGALEIAYESPEVKNIILLYCRTSVLDPLELAKAIVDVKNRYRDVSKPILVSMIGGIDVKEASKYLNRNNIPTYPIPERAVKSLAKLIEYYRFLKKHKLESLTRVA
ncbi:MAG: CoA-binding protein [Desulfurococcaceae archaeon]